MSNLKAIRTKLKRRVQADKSLRALAGEVAAQAATIQGELDISLSGKIKVLADLIRTSTGELRADYNAQLSTEASARIVGNEDLLTRLAVLRAATCDAMKASVEDLQESAKANLQEVARRHMELDALHWKHAESVDQSFSRVSEALAAGLRKTAECQADATRQLQTALEYGAASASSAAASLDEK